MSKLWTSILESFIIICNHSGCHQLPERSFFINGKQFPVCARCTGVVIGQLLSVLVFVLITKVNIIISIVLLFVMGFDWFVQYVKIKESNNFRRFVTGVLGGFGLFGIYFNLVYFILQLMF